MRHDSLAILHSLTDHRRSLYLDRAGEVVKAPEDEGTLRRIAGEVHDQLEEAGGEDEEDLPEEA